MLQQIYDIVQEKKPDALLISGDVFDASHPSSTATRMFSDAIARLQKACPNMIIVVVARNHDSGTRHEEYSSLLAALNLHMIGIPIKDNPKAHVVGIPGKGYIAALPYANERNMPRAFYQQVLDEVAQINQNLLPVVMMAHTAVLGSDFTGHKNMDDRIIGGIDCCNVDELGSGYDYLALEHIHKMQNVSEDGRVRYCGSPMAVSFDEEYFHGVDFVEIDAQGAVPSVETIEIKNPHSIVTIPSRGKYAPWEECQQLLKEFPSDISAYIRLNVSVQDFLPPQAEHDARAIIEDKQCRFCGIQSHRDNEDNGVRAALTIQEFTDMEPLTLFEKYMSDMGKDVNDNLKDMFLEAFAKAEEKERK